MPTDNQLRVNAQKRQSILSKAPKDIPTGFITSQDAIQYIRRRWGALIPATALREFNNENVGPRGITMYGSKFYNFDTIDLWAYRKLSGVPAAWLETRDMDSSVPNHITSLTLEEFMKITTKPTEPHE